MKFKCMHVNKIIKFYRKDKLKIKCIISYNEKNKSKTVLSATA